MKMDEVLAQVEQKSFGHTHTVYGSADDAAGITGTFTARIKTLETDCLSVLSAQQADRGRRAGFHTGEQGVGVSEAMKLPIKNW